MIIPMNLKKDPTDFSSTLWQNLTQKILQTSQATTAPYYAVFDADGTLWNFDLGDTFFQFQIEKQLLPNLPKDPWQKYQNILAQGKHCEAYLWLAQINENQTIGTVRNWVQEFFTQIEFSPFLPQKRLINFLHQNNFEVFIVSATLRWALEPAAAFFNIDSEHIIGMETTVENGRLTKTPNGPPTWLEGKVEKILLKTKQVHPIFACGNSLGDEPMLRSASHIQLAVSSQHHDINAFQSEKALQKIATNENWFTHSFY